MAVRSSSVSFSLTLPKLKRASGSKPSLHPMTAMPNECTKGGAVRSGVACPRPMLQWPVPELTRRRSADHRHNCWHIYYVLPLRITAMFMSARLPSASAIRTIPIRGNGAAVSIQARIQANTSPTPPRPSKKPARISSTHCRCSCRTAPRLIFRHGAIREIGPNGNMRCGTPASAWSRPAMDRASRAGAS